MKATVFACLLLCAILQAKIAPAEDSSKSNCFSKKEGTLLTCLDPDVLRLYREGLRAATIGSYPEALRSFESVIVKQEFFPEAYAKAAFALEILGRYPEAEKYYLVSIEQWKQCAPTHFDLGRNYYKQGNLPKAVASFEEALERNPGFNEAMSFLSQAYWQQGDRQKAMEYLEKALALNPENLQAREVRAEILLEQGQYIEALNVLEGLRKKRPADPELLNRMGHAYLKLNRLPQAEKSFQEALKMQAENAQALFGLGIVAYLRKTDPEATQLFTRALKVDTAGKSRCLFYLALLQGRSAAADHNAQAEATLQKFLAQKPDDPASHYNLALLYVQSGRSKEAQGELKKVKSLDRSLYQRLKEDFKKVEKGEAVALRD